MISTHKNDKNGVLRAATSQRGLLAAVATRLIAAPLAVGAPQAARAANCALAASSTNEGNVLGAGSGQNNALLISWNIYLHRQHHTRNQQPFTKW